MDRQKTLIELDALRQRMSEIEAELSTQSPDRTSWAPSGYYGAYHLMAGMVLGLIAATASLVFNIVGAAMLNEHPLQLIRVYLTFPLGEKALEVDTGFALAAGCCLYMMTGMIGGIPFHMVLTKFFSRSPAIVRFAAATILGVGIWIINYYGVLYWLQPALIGGRWIVDKVPVLVAVSTHLVFAWTIFLVSHWGHFTPPHSVPIEEKSR